MGVSALSFYRTDMTERRLTSNLIREDRIKDLSFLNLLLATHLSISPKTGINGNPTFARSHEINPPIGLNIYSRGEVSSA